MRFVILCLQVSGKCLTQNTPQYALTHDKRKGVYKVGGGACVRNLKVSDAEHPQYALTHKKRKVV